MPVVVKEVKWMPEFRRCVPKVSIVLVGTKLDLRDDKGYLVDHPGAIAITSTQEAQNKVAAFALYQLFPDLPFDQLLIEPYASFIKKRLEEDEFSVKVQDNEDYRRTVFVDSLLAARVSRAPVFKDAKDESVRSEMLVDPPRRDDEQNLLINGAAKLPYLNGKLFFLSKSFLFQVSQLIRVVIKDVGRFHLF